MRQTPPTTDYRPPTRIAVIGAGSYVFSLSLLIDHRLSGIHLVLMDINEDMAADMARIARRMADDAGVDAQVDSTGSRSVALKGADFVTTSVAVQLGRRWQMDREVVLRHGIREILSECGGVGGLSQTLRAVPLVLDIAGDMERLCPDAWLLNMTNPLPRVLTAIARHTNVRAVGFCNAAWGDVDGYGHLARLLGRDKRDLDVVSAGLNHFAWLISIRDRRTGEDLLPAVNAAYAEGKGIGGRLSHKFWREYGAAPLSGDTHAGEFLPLDEAPDERHVGFHGDENERAARRREIAEAANGERPWRYLVESYGRSWERPADVIRSLVTGIPRHMDMVNVGNQSSVDPPTRREEQLPSPCGEEAGDGVRSTLNAPRSTGTKCLTDLPPDAIVEIPADVVDGTLRGMEIGALPGKVGEVCKLVSAVHGLAAEAAVTGDRSLVEEAIRIDPAISDKAAALRAIAELIELHGDLLPQFA